MLLYLALVMSLPYAGPAWSSHVAGQNLLEDLDLFYIG
jgi:hypothetical protein